MTKQETIQIMAMLGAFYGAGKSNPEIMADGWHIILEPYDFDMARKAVLNYAKNDVRDYASFPTVGNIVKCINDEIAKDEAPVKEIVRAISYGWGYEQLSKDAQGIITPLRYDEMLKMDAEEFANKAGKIATSLKERYKKLGYTEVATLDAQGDK